MLALAACTDLDPQPTTEATADPTGNPASTDVVLLTGPVDTGGLNVGGLFARGLNAAKPTSAVRVAVRASASCRYNLRAVSNGDAPFALVQAQILKDPSTQEAAISSTRGKIRIIAHLFEACCTLLATPKSGIVQVEDLRDKRVAILTNASTDRMTLGHLAAILDLPITTESSPMRGAIVVVEQDLATIEESLRTGTVHAFFSSVAHPSSLVARLLSRTPAKPVPIVFAPDRLQAQPGDYAAASVPAGVYPQVEGDIVTIGTPGLLVSSVDVTEDQVAAILRGLWSAIDTIAQTPVFRLISQAFLLDGVATEDLHSGAVQFFGREGLLPTTTPTRPFTPDLPSRLSYESVEDIGPEAIKAAQSLITATDVPDAPTHTPTAVGGLVDLISKVASGTIGFALASETSFQGLGLPGAEERDHLTLSPIRAIARLGGKLLHVVAAGAPRYPRRGAPPPVTRMEELAGRLVGVSDPQAAALLTIFSDTLAEKGQTRPVAVMMARESLLDALKTGKISAFFLMDLVPSNIVARALTATPPGLLLPLPESFVVPAPWATLSIPAQSYGAQPTQPIGSFTTPVALITHALMPNARVRAIADALVAGNKALPDETWPFKDLPVPPHPGLGDRATVGPTETVPTVPLLIGAGDPSEPSFDVTAGIAQRILASCGAEPRAASCVGPFHMALLPTDGEMDTLERIAAGDLHFGLVRGDLVAQAVAGEGRWKGEPQPSLRSVCALYSLSLTAVVTSPEHLASQRLVAGIDLSTMAPQNEQGSRPILSLDDLEGRRISLRQDLGVNPRSNAMTTFRLQAFRTRQWSTALQAIEPLPLEAFALFEHGDVDALFWLTAHPHPVLDNLLQRCKGTHVIGLTGIDRDLVRVPGAQRTLIDIAPYEGQKGPHFVPSVGVPILLITTENEPEDHVQGFLATLTDHILNLRASFPLLSQLSRSSLKPDNFMPIHPAAERFFAS